MRNLKALIWNYILLPFLPILLTRLLPFLNLISKIAFTVCMFWFSQTLCYQTSLDMSNIMQNTSWKLNACVSSSIISFWSCVFHMDAHCLVASMSWINSMTWGESQTTPSLVSICKCLFGCLPPPACCVKRDNMIRESIIVKMAWLIDTLTLFLKTTRIVTFAWSNTDCIVSVHLRLRAMWFW